MLPSWFSQSVTRLRAKTRTVRGATVPDWSDPDSKEITGCSVQPSSTSLSQDGRVLGIAESFTIYMQPDADIQEGDRIVYEGNTYIVSGMTRPWSSPTGALSNKQATIERWEG